MKYKENYDFLGHPIEILLHPWAYYIFNVSIHRLQFYYLKYVRRRNTPGRNIDLPKKYEIKKFV